MARPNRNGIKHNKCKCGAVIPWEHRRCQTCREAYSEKCRSHCRKDEPTQAEVDAMVAEQMANLPDWWHSAWPKEDDDEFDREEMTDQEKRNARQRLKRKLAKKAKSQKKRKKSQQCNYL